MLLGFKYNVQEFVTGTSKYMTEYAVIAKLLMGKKSNVRFDYENRNDAYNFVKALTKHAADTGIPIQAFARDNKVYVGLKEEHDNGGNEDPRVHLE